MEAYTAKPLDVNERFDLGDCSQPLVGLKSADPIPNGEGGCIGGLLNPPTPCP